MSNKRREFLLRVMRRSGQLAAAHVVVYAFSVAVVGKGKFGGLTAGAKCLPPQIPVGPFCCDAVFTDANGQTVCI